MCAENCIHRITGKYSEKEPHRVIWSSLLAIHCSTNYGFQKEHALVLFIFHLGRERLLSDQSKKQGTVMMGSSIMTGGQLRNQPQTLI